MTEAERFTAAGRVSYAMLDTVCQAAGVPVRLRIFLSMLSRVDSSNQLKGGIGELARDLNTTINNRQLYDAVAWLENEDWIRRQGGKYYVNPLFFWRGRLDKYSAAFEIALRNYKTIGVTKNDT